jgi:hypothetical protein
MDGEERAKNSPAAVHDVPLNGFAFCTRLELFGEIQFWILAVRADPMALTMNVSALLGEHGWINTIFVHFGHQLG